MEQQNSPREVEAAHPPRGVRPPRLHPVHASHARPFLERSFQILQLLAAAFRDNLDCAVVVVANPSLKAELLRLALDEIPKPDPLHVTVDHGVKPLHV